MASTKRGSKEYFMENNVHSASSQVSKCQEGIYPTDTQKNLGRRPRKGGWQWAWSEDRPLLGRLKIPGPRLTVYR